MKLLALDTSGDACSCCLYLDGEQDEEFTREPRRHAELLLPMVERLLTRAGIVLGALDALAFGRGPGSFTGLRIAAGVTQGLAFGAGLPVVPVSSLAAMARGVWRTRGHERVLAAFDARIGEVYLAAYGIDARGAVSEVLPERVCAPGDAVPVEGGDWFGAGSAWGVHGSVLADVYRGALAGTDPGCEPRATDVAALGVAGFEAGLRREAEQAVPVYLREEVAHRGGGQ